MRLFIAIPVSEAVRRGAAQAVAALRPAEADVKWVETENLHVTLAFLGTQAPERIQAAEAAMARAAAGLTRFELGFGALGAFPTLQRPKAIWLGASRGKDALAALAAALSRELTQAGFHLDNRPFSAHLTLGRVRSPRNGARLRQAAASLADRETSMTVGRIALYESRLSEAGPSYRRLAETRLGGAV